MVVPLTLEAPAFCKYSKCLSSPTCFVPWNITCSNRCANPVRPATSSFEPTLYQTSTTTSGMRWSSCRITSSPLGSVYFSKGSCGVFGDGGGVTTGGISAVFEATPRIANGVAAGQRGVERQQGHDTNQERRCRHGAFLRTSYRSIHARPGIRR